MIPTIISPVFFNPWRPASVTFRLHCCL